jgi:hypothetical protein
VFGLLILGTVLIFVPGLTLFATFFNGIVYGAALTGAVYLVNALRLKIISIITKPKISDSKISDTIVVSVLFFTFLCLPFHAAGQDKKLPKIQLMEDVTAVPHHPDKISEPAPFYAVGQDKKLPKIQFPENAIIVPYSPDKISEDALPDPDNLTSPEQSLLISYRQYAATLELLQKRNEKDQKIKNVQNFIIPFAVSAAEYQMVLPTGGDDILLQGKIKIAVFTDKPIFVPLTLENGILVQPLLDGKPAILHSKSNHQTFLFVEGNGSHELLFGIRVRIQRQGGWRIVTGKLPVTATSKITLTLPDERGDLLTGNPFDKKKWSFGTNNINDTNTDITKTTTTKTHEKIIETSLEPNGFFHWQWRSAVSGENVDRNLEVESVIQYDIQEGAVWLQWTPTFRISRGKWEMIRLCLPQDYLIAEIKGENVRGWNIVQEDAKTKTIDVELLKPAEKIETLSILLSAPQWFVKPLMSLSLPKLSIPDARIHQGRIDVFCSSVMNLRVLESAGLLPTDQVYVTKPKQDLKFNTISPLGSSLFHSYRFPSENYSLRIKWTRSSENLTAQSFSVLKLTRQDAILETKIIVNGQNKPFYVSIQLPEKFVLKNVNVPDGIFWNKDWENDNEKRLNIICADGRSQRVEILVAGDYSTAFSKERNEIATLPVFKVEKMEIDTTIAVLTEPSLDVRADVSGDFRTETPDSVFSWLSLPEQRDLVRLVLYSWASSKKIDGKLVLSERKPEIRCSTISNVRTTAEAIEETILIDFDITKAGVRNIEFVLPAWMNNAKIVAPFLRRKTVTAIDTKNTDSPVLVRLELHEEVMEQFRILVQSDRRLQTETDYQVFVPIIRTGQTMRQYIVMENDRRSPDEMIVERLRKLHPLNRQQSEWTYLASILGGNVTEAYFATKKEGSGNNISGNSVSGNNNSVNNISGNNISDDTANLLFRMKRRETVQLADAQIDLAETRFTLGDNGDYRAEQIYRIDNKKEPYLDIMLPEGATLWGARILTAGEWQQKERNENKNNIGLPIKPNIMPAEIAGHYRKNATKSQLIRIPLVKTESGDMDFIVRLVYAGELQKFSLWSRMDIPFIEVLNIPVSESLVRLNLPYRYEYQFAGNLQRVRQEQESETIRQVQSNYQRQQTDRLRQIAQSLNPFASKRAKFNLKQIDMSSSLSGSDKIISSLDNYDTNTIGTGQNVYLGGQIVGNGSIIPFNETNKSAESQNVAPDETKISFESNSATLSSNFYNQTNKFSGQLVQKKALAINKTENQSAAINNSSSFNSNWFTSNSLSNQNVTAWQGSGINGGGIVEFNDTTNIADQITNQNTNQNNISENISGRIPVSSPQQTYPVPQQQIIPQQTYPVPQQQIIPQQQMQQAISVPQQQVIPQQQRSVEIVQGNIVLGKSIDKSKGIGDTINEKSQVDNQEETTSAWTMADPISSSSFKNDKNSRPNDGGFFKNEYGLKEGKGNHIMEKSEPKLRGSGTFAGTNDSGQTIINTLAAIEPEEITPINSVTTKRGRKSSKQSNEKPASSATFETIIDTLEAVTPETEQSGETNNTAGISEQILPTLSAQTSSLDIEIPQIGKTFLFVAPQGSLDLSFRTISNRTGSRGFQMLMAFLGLAFLYGIYRLCLSIGKRLKFDRRTHRNIAGLVTLLSVLSLILAPLVSVLFFIFAVILWITFFQRKVTI